MFVGMYPSPPVKLSALGLRRALGVLERSASFLEVVSETSDEPPSLFLGHTGSPAKSDPEVTASSPSERMF